MDSDWVEVQRSVPAGTVEGVPDEATVYACHTATTKHVTVYVAESAYFAALGEDSSFHRVMKLGPDPDVEMLLDEIRENWEAYADGKAAPGAVGGQQQ